MKTVAILLLAILTIIPTLSANAVSPYTPYKNEQFNYEIMLPSTWEVLDLTLTDKHIMYSSPDSVTKIKLKALKSDAASIDSIIRDNKWNLRGIDPRLNKIIETEKITIKKNVQGKLLVFEYRSGKGTMLQRSLVTVNGGIVYILECKSTLKNFYRFDAIFNAVFSSFNFLRPDQQSEEKMNKAG